MKKMILAILFIALATPVYADEAKIPEPETFVTEHTGEFNGTRVRYTATAGETYLKDENGAPRASIFSTSYIRTDVKNNESRPVVFLWNGGPGSASLWLHMGVFGPKRVDIPSDARDDGAAPYRVIDNPGAFLDIADIVFIDPVGTGFSRALGETKREEFYSINKDARSVAEFIRIWLNKNKRWNSPKYIGGESYGTTRSAAVINELEGRFDDVSMNGIILISSILDFSIDTPAPGNEVAFITVMPTLAATAWYHDKVDKTGHTLASFVAAAKEFAIGEYALALLKGNDLGDDERAAVRAKLSGFIGISEDYIDDADLRVNHSRFQKELLRDEGLSVGRLDSRYQGVDYDNAGEYPDVDPSFYGIDGAYTAALNSYMRGDLGVEIERQYSVIGGLGGRWDWALEGRDFSRGYLNVAPYIGRAMRENSGLRVFNAMGYYDFATPMFGAEYSLKRTGIPDERITFEYYEAGHMMYIHHPSLHKLLADVRAFIVAGQ